MKIFISWSGDTSKKLAEALHRWLPVFLQSTKPYYTPESIRKGDKWLNSIIDNLKESSACIICLTPDNLEKPWILFEAGAISNRFSDSLIHPLAFGFSKANIKSPLNIFQSTDFDEDDFKKLLKSLNIQLGEQKISDQIFDINFEAFYPKFESEINAILEEKKPSVTAEEIRRDDRELLEELLDSNKALRKSLQSLSSRVNHMTDFFDNKLRREYLTDGSYYYDEEKNVIRKKAPSYQRLKQYYDSTEFKQLSVFDPSVYNPLDDKIDISSFKVPPPPPQYSPNSPLTTFEVPPPPPQWVVPPPPSSSAVPPAPSQDPISPPKD